MKDGVCIADMDRRLGFNAAFCHCRAKGGSLPTPLTDLGLTETNLLKLLMMIRFWFEPRELISSVRKTSNV